MSNNLLFTVFNVISVVRVYWILERKCVVGKDSYLVLIIV